jgi:hypothetical protein
MQFYKQHIGKKLFLTAYPWVGQMKGKIYGVLGKLLKIVTNDIACAKLALLETASGFDCWCGLKGCNFGRLKFQRVVK